MNESEQPQDTSMERLDSVGEPLKSERTPRTRSGVIIGGLAGAVAVTGVGLWGWSAYFAQGPQPDQALPDDTLAYTSIDLDPPANQKVEAIKTLRKFPGVRQDLDLNTDDDLRKKLFEAVQSDGACKDLDYEDDVEPWLGERAAAALIPGEKGEEPSPVIVLQVTDSDAAEDKLPDVVECLSAAETGSWLEESDTDVEEGAFSDSDVVPEEDVSSDETKVEGYSFVDDWVVLAETEKIAVDVTDSAQDGSLADDDTYQDWMERVGDPGIMSMYVAPAAGELIQEEFTKNGGTLPDGDAFSMKDFSGGAATVRFADDGIEMEFAGDQSALAGVGLFEGDAGDSEVSDLPETTAVALGGTMSKDWLRGLITTFSTVWVGTEGDTTVEEMEASIEQELGLSVDEIQALTESPFAIALDGEFNLQEVEAEGPSALPVGFKLTGDSDEIEAALDKIRAQLPEPDALISRTVDDGVLVATSEDYLDQLEEGGQLGDSERFEEVLPDADDAAALVYIDFDAGGWLDELLSDETDREMAENVEPLQALGLSIDTDGDVAHGTLRLTVD